MQQFRTLQALQTSDGINFTNIIAAMPVFSNAFPGTSGLGAIASGALEILPSYHMPDSVPLPQSGVRIQANNLLDGANSLESSEDLVHWTSLSPVNANNIGAAEYYDTNTLVAAGRFYRAIVMPPPQAATTQTVIIPEIGVMPPVTSAY